MLSSMTKYILAFLFFARVVWAEAMAQPDPLLQLLELMEVPHDGTPSSIVQETQKRWIRPAGKERWEMADLTLEKKEKVLQLADQMGFIQEIRPTKQEYDYVLLLGATVFRMQARLEHMAQLWKEGIRFNKVVILTGMRPLDPKAEDLIAKTESEAAHILWDRCELNFLPVSFVEVPMNGSIRPTTQDTIIRWMEEFPEPGSSLFISNQPYCHYQGAIVDLVLPDKFEHETVGNSADPTSLNGAVVLDTIARWLYSGFSSKQ